MSSEDNKTITFDKPKKPKNKKSIGWIIGVVVLILISITFILPTTFLASNHEIIFGSIHGKNVTLTDQYFQTQASMLTSQYGDQANTLQGSYTIWNQAFLSTIANIGLKEMASDAGIKTTDNYVDRAIINSGFYSNGDGVFDPDLYNNASSYEKQAFRAYMQDSVPASLVASDISRTHSSNGEIALIQDLNSKGRSFDYVVIDSTSYPAERVQEYAAANPQQFLKASIYSVSVPTEDEAASILEAVNNGTTTILDEAEKSAANDGDRGSVFYFSVANELTTATDADQIFSASEGDIIGPLQSMYGYTIYQLASTPAEAIFDNDDDLNQARNYIALHETDMMNSYLDESAAAFTARIDAGDDFFTVAEDMGLSVTTVASTVANPANFPLFTSFQLTDPNYNLYNATYFNGNYMNQLYTGEEGTVLPAETLTSGGRLITRIGAEETDNGASSYISTMYPYLKSQMALTDLQQAIFLDPTFEDNFASVFFTQLMGSSI